jgi:hypothetical protein
VLLVVMMMTTQHYATPVSSVPRCRTTACQRPSVLPEGPDQVLNRMCQIPAVEIAEALLQNTIVRRIGLEPQDYDENSAAMGKYLEQSKQLLSCS